MQTVTLLAADVLQALQHMLVANILQFVMEKNLYGSTQQFAFLSPHMPFLVAINSTVTVLVLPQNQISCQIQHVCEARRRLGKGSMPVEAALQTLLAHLQSLQDSLSLPSPCFTEGSCSNHPSQYVLSSKTVLAEHLLYIVRYVDMIPCACL